MLNDVTEGVSKEFAELVNRMLVKDPDERITLIEMVDGFKKLQQKFSSE
jgi:serine/threonine protein kinase